MKPREVEVTPRGKIDRACEGGNAWVDILRSMAPYELDISIIHVKDQNPIGNTLSLNGHTFSI
jgi:hypothetical protein